MPKKRGSGSGSSCKPSATDNSCQRRLVRARFVLMLQSIQNPELETVLDTLDTVAQQAADARYSYSSCRGRVFLVFASSSLVEQTTPEALLWGHLRASARSEHPLHCLLAVAKPFAMKGPVASA